MKEFWIDPDSFLVEAETKKEALEKAEVKIKQEPEVVLPLRVEGEEVQE